MYVCLDINCTLKFEKLETAITKDLMQGKLIAVAYTLRTY